MFSVDNDYVMSSISNLNECYKLCDEIFISVFLHWLGSLFSKKTIKFFVTKTPTNRLHQTTHSNHSDSGGGLCLNFS